MGGSDLGAFSLREKKPMVTVVRGGAATRLYREGQIGGRWPKSKGRYGTQTSGMASGGFETVRERAGHRRDAKGRARGGGGDCRRCGSFNATAGLIDVRQDDVESGMIERPKIELGANWKKLSGAIDSSSPNLHQ